MLTKEERSHLDISLMMGRTLLFLKTFNLSEYGRRMSFRLNGLQGYRIRFHLSLNVQDAVGDKVEDFNN